MSSSFFFIPVVCLLFCVCPRIWESGECFYSYFPFLLSACCADCVPGSGNQGNIPVSFGSSFPFLLSAYYSEYVPGSGNQGNGPVLLFPSYCQPVVSVTADCVPGSGNQGNVALSFSFFPFLLSAYYSEYVPGSGNQGNVPAHLIPSCCQPVVLTVSQDLEIRGMLH